MNTEGPGELSTEQVHAEDDAAQLSPDQVAAVEMVRRHYHLGDDDLDDEIDDDEIREQILARINRHHDSDNGWVVVTQTDESITVALETNDGCLVRVIAWGLDGLEHHTTTWCPGLTLIALKDGV